MLVKFFSSSLIICALCFNARSQKSMTNAGKTSGNADKFVSAEDAAKSALNVGATMPQFSLKDANGKIVESGDLLKQGNLVVFYRGA